MFFAGVLLALQITGSEFAYTVKANDSWLSIAANVGVDARVLASTNNLKTGSKLKAGQTLKVDNRHIVPSADDVDIVINIPQRLLFHMVPEGDPVAYPIAAGKASWPTPRGPFSILTKEVNPAWDVPPSIQEEMRREGKPVLTRVPPGPKNPLGGYWIGLSMAGIGIHGTNAPTSVYRLRTHGCIRVGQIRELFSEVSVGMTGRFIYEPVLVAQSGDSVFVEVHPDIYKKGGGDPYQEVLKQAFTKGVGPMLDLAILQEVIQKREGIARDVTLR